VGRLTVTSAPSRRRRYAVKFFATVSASNAEASAIAAGSEAGSDLVDAEAGGGLGVEPADVIVQAGDLGEHGGLARRPALGFADERAAAHAVAETLPTAVETAAKIERRRRSAGAEIDRLALLGAQRCERAAKAAALVPIELPLDG